MSSWTEPLLIETYTCQRCGNKKNLYYTQKPIGGKYEHAKYQIDTSDIENEPQSYELCKKCFTEIEDFITKK